MEINRSNYFKIKNKYLVISILRKIFSFMAAISITLLIAWAIIITIYEQNGNSNNFFMNNRAMLTLILRYVVIIPVSIFIILFIIDRIMHNKLKSMKKILGVIDDI